MKTIQLELTEREVDVMVELMEEGLIGQKANLDEIMHPDDVDADVDFQEMKKQKESIFEKLHVTYVTVNPLAEGGVQ